MLHVADSLSFMMAYGLLLLSLAKPLQRILPNFCFSFSGLKVSKMLYHDRHPTIKMLRCVHCAWGVLGLQGVLL